MKIVVNIVEELKEFEAEICNLQEKLTEICNPTKNGVKIVINGILKSLEEARQGISFYIKLLENSDSIQHSKKETLEVCNSGKVQT